MQPSPPRASALKTGTFILIAVLGNSFGNLLLAFGMERMPDFSNAPLPHYMLLLIANPFLLPGAFLSAVYTFSQLSLFSWADLSFVVPMIASSYIVTTLLSQFILGEKVDLPRWLGVVLISIGVALISRTPPRTANEPEAEPQKAARL
jgi:drug/metabolite transporter (DMT)-like permease